MTEMVCSWSAMVCDKIQESWERKSEVRVIVVWVLEVFPL